MKKVSKKAATAFYKYKAEHEKYFKDVVFLVEANAYEKHSLWNDFFHTPRYINYKLDSWGDIMEGAYVEIGQVDNRPVCVSITWGILNGYKVLFYNACSQVVDYKMVEKWTNHFPLQTLKYNPNLHSIRCDAENFYNCIRAINSLKENKVPKVGL